MRIIQLFFVFMFVIKMGHAQARPSAGLARSPAGSAAFRASFGDVHMEGEHWSEPLHGKIWIEDGTRLQAQTQGGLVLWSALKSGVVDVRNGDVQRSFTIFTLRQKKSLAALQEAVDVTLGLKVEINLGVIEIRGRLLRFDDWEALARACANLHCSYRFRAQVPETLVAETNRQFEKKLLQISHYPYRIELGYGASLHVPVKDPSKVALHELLDRYGIEQVEDKSAIELSPLVKVQITLAEVRHDSDIKFGANWTSSYSAQVLNNFVSTTGSLTADLVANDQNGISKILASPNLLCNSGKEAEFLAGGEFPIRILNYKIQDVVWKKYGIMLKVRPLADLNGRMSIYIETEVSRLDNASSVDNIPGINISRVQSYFDLTQSQTIALSGLIRKEDSENSQNGIPLLARIPILGALFSSKEFLDNKTELVIFVRPEIVNLEKQKVTQNE